MKNFNHLLFFVLLIAGTFEVSAYGIDSSMEGFKLETCSEKSLQCLTVKAEHSQGSQFKQLLTLVKPEILISAKQKTVKKEILIKGDTGYIDLDENQIVVFKRQGKVLHETSINLTTFDRLQSEHGAL
ncbi:MAG: hypothetical protein ACXVCY_02395 [Pseudobdellovibrionaceae bacterium]